MMDEEENKEEETPEEEEISAPSEDKDDDAGKPEEPAPADGWTTAPMGSSAAAEPKSPPEPLASEPEEPTKEPDPWATAPVTGSAAAESTPAAPSGSETVQPTPTTVGSGEAASGSQGNSIAFMESLGIKDPNTQRYILFGTIGVVVLCCACSCMAVVIPTLLSG